jgi:hypothetical protein
MLQDHREERLCRMWLLAIAILHWIVFGLLLRNSDYADAAPAAAGTLAAALTEFLSRA